MTSAGYSISRDKSKLDVDLIHDFLSNRAYWAKGRSREDVEKTIRHSECFGLYASDGSQVGFARVVTDFTVYAFIMDVFIIESCRGQGLGKMLMHAILHDDEMARVGKWALGTRDANGLYEQFGFTAIKYPERMMERVSS